MVNELLTMSSAAALLGNSEDPTLFPISELLDESLEAVTPKAGDSTVKLRVIGEDFRVELHRARMCQVLVNLLSNALKFGEGKPVTCSARRMSDTLLIEVEDIGVGIHQDHLHRVFEPFFKVDHGGSIFDGIGLGLSICKELVESMGGSITVKSKLPTGTVFRVALPNAIPALSDPGTACDLRDKTVLVVDDAEDIQELLRYELAEWGCRVSVAKDGVEGSMKALNAKEKGQPYDLILMDMQMPRMDGYDATRHLRTQGYQNRIVAITAHRRPNDEEAFFEVGCDAFLRKPLDFGVLRKEFS